MLSHYTLTEKYEDRVLFPVPTSGLFAPGLSLIANTIVIATCLITKSYKTPLEKMVLAVNFTDLLYDVSRVSGLVYTPSSEIYCKAFETIAKFGVLSSITWSALFGHALLLVSKAYDEKIVSKSMAYYTFFAVVPPFGLAIASIFSDYAQYSEDLHACVHRVYLGETNWSFFIYLGIPLMITCGLSVIFFSLAACRLKRILVKDMCQIWTLAVYPCILLVCWTPILVSQSFAAFGRVPSSQVTIALHALDQLQGFFDALVYGGSRNTLRALCGKICHKKKQRNSSHSSQESLLSNSSSRILIRKIPSSIIRKDTSSTNHKSISLL